MQEQPVLVIFGGPNGSGKSTIRAIHASRIPEYYINADEIAQSKVPSGNLNAVDEKTRNKINIEAANEADALRAEAIAEKRSFSTESVMSTEKGLKIMGAAKNSGYHVHLMYVLLSSPEINIARIQKRVALGGHPVPEEKTFSRYNRCMELLPKEISIADIAKVYDNTTTEPVIILEKTLDKEIRVYPQELPSEWTQARLEEIKAKVEATDRLEELVASPDEKSPQRNNNIKEIALYPAQPDRAYRGEILDIDFQEDTVIQEISHDVAIEHKGLTGSFRQGDIGKRFSIAYDNQGGVSITQERHRDRDNEIDR